MAAGAFCVTVRSETEVLRGGRFAYDVGARFAYMSAHLGRGGSMGHQIAAI